MAASEYASEPEHRHVEGSSTAATASGGSGAHQHGELLALQQSAGNSAVSALVQAKMEVGAVDDPLEAEADQVAARVVKGIQRQTTGGDAHAHGAGCGCDAHGITTLRRSDADEGVGAAGGELDTDTGAALRQASGGGQALDPDVQRSMESGFGADFSGVKVYHDGQSDQLNRQLGARAFTAGSDIYFRQGEYAPSSAGGQELLAHELTHVVQQGAAATATDTVNRSADPEVLQRKAYSIGTTGEKLEVSWITSKKKREALLKEAEDIISFLKATYDVTVNSSETIEAIKAQYTQVKTKVHESLQTRAWRIQELRALKRALGFYAAILGANRADSTRSGVDQEVANVGKLKNAIDSNKPAGKLDTDTLGEYFRGKKSMGLFKSSEGLTYDADNEFDQLTGTFVHEVAHGLLNYAVDDYIAATAFWQSRNKQLPANQQTENPVTGYGRTNAAEDLCESARFYFVYPDRLKKNCPLRYAFMQKLGTDWLPPPVEAPQVQPEAEGSAPKSVGGTTGDTEVPAEVETAAQEVEEVVDTVESTPTPEPEQTGDTETTTGDTETTTEDTAPSGESTAPSSSDTEPSTRNTPSELVDDLI